MIFVGVILFMAFLFKPVYAPKIDYSGEYGLDSKSAKGFYGLKTLLEKSIKRNLIKNDSFNLSTLKYKKGVTALYINSFINLNESQSKELAEFIKAGNTAIFLANNFQYDTGVFKNTNSDKNTESIDSLHKEPLDSIILDDDLPEQESEFQDEQAENNQIPADTTKNRNHLQNDFSENCKQVYFVESGLKLDTILSKKIIPSHFIGFEADTIQPFLMCGERIVAYALPHANGTLLVHHAPELFGNIHLNEKWYKENAEFIFDHLLGDEIYIMDTAEIQQMNEFLLSELLKKRPLKYAYYLTLALVFVSILVSIKRKYRPTNVMVQKQNLSMQYAKSLSRLFFVESDYYNMVVKIKENFYHYVQKHFYLNPSDPDFVRLLAKRTGASVTLIQSIISLSEVTKNQKLDEHYFMELYQKTEQFKKISSSWK